jgi:hypothetical protein
MHNRELPWLKGGGKKLSAEQTLQNARRPRRGDAKSS